MFFAVKEQSILDLALKIVKKEKEHIFVLAVVPSYSNHQPNMKVDRVGHHFFKAFQMFSKPK